VHNVRREAATWARSPVNGESRPLSLLVHLQVSRHAVYNCMQQHLQVYSALMRTGQDLCVDGYTQKNVCTLLDELKRIVSECVHLPIFLVETELTTDLSNRDSRPNADANLNLVIEIWVWI
jgi:hypothetical protein